MIDKKLTTMMSLPSTTGGVTLGALAGLFTIKNAPLLAFMFIVGPSTLLLTIMLEGDIKDRMLAALIAGIIATICVIIAAGLGPKLLEFLNIKVFKILGGLAIISIGLIVMEINIHEKIPSAIMILALIVSFIMR